jgi:sigma-B regulation protein RsbU (phosphoserine phosphatase)
LAEAPTAGESGQHALNDLLEAYESAPCGLLTLSRDGTIERVNHTFCVWIGLSAEQLHGKRLPELLTVGSKLFHHTHWQPLLEMQGSVAEVQLELLLAGGTTLPVLVNAVRRGDLRVDVGLFVAADRRKYERELLLARRRAEELLEREQEAQQARALADRRTEEALRQREDSFRTLAENSPDIIARLDLARRFVYISPAVQTLTRRPAVELVGKRLGELELPLDDTEGWKAAVERAFEGQDITHPLRYRNADGSFRELQARLVPERNGQGELTSVLALTRDVTALKTQERDAQHRAVVAEQLIGIVSHDLRNPLNAILLGTQLLEASTQGAPSRVVRRIASAAQRASRLITDLLDFTQARLGGGLRVSPGELDLEALLAECVEELRLAWPGRQIEQRHAGAGTCVADADRLAQIVTNLVSNAMTYGTPDQPVTISTVVSDAGLGILVHNEGPAIPDELQAQMFEPLRRGDDQMQRGSRSVGLGLYIVREIASAHGGRVTVRSVEGEGTTFQVELPRRVPASAAERA